MPKKTLHICLRQLSTYIFIKSPFKQPKKTPTYYFMYLLLHFLVHIHLKAYPLCCSPSVLLPITPSFTWFPLHYSSPLIHQTEKDKATKLKQGQHAGQSCKEAQRCFKWMSADKHAKTQESGTMQLFLSTPSSAAISTYRPFLSAVDYKNWTNSSSQQNSHRRPQGYGHTAFSSFKCFFSTSSLTLSQLTETSLFSFLLLLTMQGQRSGVTPIQINQSVYHIISNLAGLLCDVLFLVTLNLKSTSYIFSVNFSLRPNCMESKVCQK